MVLLPLLFVLMPNKEAAQMFSLYWFNMANEASSHPLTGTARSIHGRCSDPSVLLVLVVLCTPLQSSNKPYISGDEQRGTVGYGTGAEVRTGSFRLEKVNGDA